MFNAEVKSTKQQILEGTFDYLIKNGLENASIRNVCKHTGFSKGAITYHYAKKDDMICAAAEYGLECISDRIFKHFQSDVSDIDGFFNTCLTYIDEVKNELRFIYQVASSPVYGDRMHNSNSRFRNAYDEYARKLAKMSGGDFDEIKPIIYSFAASVIDYAIWQDRKETQAQLNYLCKMLKRGMKTMDMENVPLSTLSDMAEYLYKEKITFTNYEGAESFFKLGIAE